MTEQTVPGGAERLAGTLDAALQRLELARPFAKPRFQGQVLDVVGRLAAAPDGVERLYVFAPRMDVAGLFQGSDYDRPDALLPQLVAGSLDGPSAAAAALETASLLRMLAIAKGEVTHPGVHADGARRFLRQVLALNMHRLFGVADEAARARPREAATRALFRFLAEEIGLSDALEALVAEIWRILAQRPIQTGPAREMIVQTAMTLAEKGAEIEGRIGADRLVSALFGPTTASLDDPGLEEYRERLWGMEASARLSEARGLARAMHDTGLVSDYHAAFMGWAMEAGESDLAPEALGLGPTGLGSWRRERVLIESLIRVAVTPATPQAALGLAGLLERGLLHQAPIAPALWRQLATVPTPSVAERLAAAFGWGATPAAHLLAGVLQVLGQPLGVGQGANPTCQSARAIAMWALNDPDRLLHHVAQATRHDAVRMQFEGTEIDSTALPAGLALRAPLDADPVSVLLVPHLDRVYAEMGRLCVGRSGDPHQWINPEFHGWWVGRACHVAVHVPTGALADLEGFLVRFFLSYHPACNGGEPVIHPQPAGVAVTDSSGRFIGWHAIAVLRVAEDREGAMRVYFYNPNNDSGQDWGGEVVVSTEGMGERPGEASLPFDAFASRLYLFHDDPLRPVPVAAPDAGRIGAVAERVRRSWAAGRADLDAGALAAAES